MQSTNEKINGPGKEIPAATSLDLVQQWNEAAQIDEMLKKEGREGQVFRTREDVWEFTRYTSPSPLPYTILFMTSTEFFGGKRQS